MRSHTPRDSHWVQFQRRVAQEVAVARTRVPDVKPAEQMRVTLDVEGRPALRGFPPDVRWMISSYGD